MKKSTYYFSHDYNASNDVKILFMRQQLGMEGYGIYWFLIEYLADAGGVLPMKIIPVLAMQMQSQEVKVRAVIEQFELFQICDEIFYSSRLQKSLDKMIELKQCNSNKGKISAERRKATAVQQQLNNGSTDDEQSKEKERKEKEIKENTSIELKFNTEVFKNKWEEFLLYKKEQFNFTYKSESSECTARKSLEKMSATEQDAIDIIDQSIANGWKGFFELKTKQNATNQTRFDARLEWANRTNS